MTYTFPLPATGTEQAPPFTTAGECGAWLANQPLTNHVQMQALLLKGLNQLNRYALPAAERLAILERLREPVHGAQEDNARRFIDRPLPLAPPEQAAFDTCQSIWGALATGYLHCLAACLAGESGIAERMALVAQRALAALVDAQYDTSRGGHLPSPGHWRLLHQAYAAAERGGMATVEVADPLRSGRNPTTPLAAWCEGLLLYVASPYELPQRQMVWVARWARRWSGKLAVSATPDLSSRALPLCVDLDGERPAGHQPQSGPAMRFLDTTALRSSIKKRVALLARGESPKKLQLGEDCVQPQCQELLIQVYYRWCKGGSIRQHERRPASGACTLVGDVAAIHYYLAGRKPFQQPGGGGLSDTQIRRQREEIATFGRLKTDTPPPPDYSKQQGYQVEQWEVMEDWNMLDHSATGVRIQRPPSHGGARFGSGQLVAVRPADAKSLLLGSVRWVLIDAQGVLQAGVHIIAGTPQTVAVRGTGLDALREKYSPGFLLPEVAALQEPATVIIPPGWFKRERVLEVFSTRPFQVRLSGLVYRGSDFERATYVTV